MSAERVGSGPRGIAWCAVVGLLLVVSAGAALPAAAQPAEAGMARPWHAPVEVVADSETLHVTYADDGSWFMGDAHVHSVAHGENERPSWSTAARLAALARDQGLDFLVLTDHDVVTRTPEVDDFTLVRGIEVTVTRSDGRPHVVGIGAVGSLYWQGMTDQQVLDALVEQGAFAVLAHPNGQPAWAQRSSWPPEVVAGATNFVGLEIYNHPSEQKRAAGVDGWALEAWFAALSAGKQVWGFSISDLHKEGRFGYGYIVVQAPTRDADDLMDAMAAGRFIAVASPTAATPTVWPSRIAAVGDTLWVETLDSPAVRGVVYDAEGQVRHESVGPLLSYAATGDEGFLVVELVGADGTRLFLQPVRVGDGPDEPIFAHLEDQLPPETAGQAADEKIPGVSVPVALLVLAAAACAWRGRRA